MRADTVATISMRIACRGAGFLHSAVSTQDEGQEAHPLAPFTFSGRWAKLADIEGRWADLIGVERREALRADLRRVVAGMSDGRSPQRLRPVW